MIHHGRSQRRPTSRSSWSRCCPTRTGTRSCAWLLSCAKPARSTARPPPASASVELMELGKPVRPRGTFEMRHNVRAIETGRLVREGGEWSFGPTRREYPGGLGEVGRAFGIEFR